MTSAPHSLSQGSNPPEANRRFNAGSQRFVQDRRCCREVAASEAAFAPRFPFRIPKLYFADINRDTTNYVLTVERINFGKRGKVVNGKVEPIQRKPFEILPVCGKYQAGGRNGTLPTARKTQDYPLPAGVSDRSTVRPWVDRSTADEDYLLEDAPSVYYALFREMAHLAAWDHQGRYDSFFGAMTKYTEKEFLESQVKRCRKGC